MLYQHFTLNALQTLYSNCFTNNSNQNRLRGTWGSTEATRSVSRTSVNTNIRQDIHLLYTKCFAGISFTECFTKLLAGCEAPGGTPQKHLSKSHLSEIRNQCFTQTFDRLQGTWGSTATTRSASRTSPPVSDNGSKPTPRFNGEGCRV